MEPEDLPRADKFVRNFPNKEYRRPFPAIYRYVQDHKKERIDEDEVYLFADPRFPSRRGDARCYQMFADKLKCLRKHGENPGTVCDYYVKRVPLVCSPSRIERWEAALDNGKLFRV